MHDYIITAMVKELKPTLKSPTRAKQILEKFWSDKMALVWDVQDVHTAVHGEFVIEVRRGGDPAPLLLSPMLGMLLVHEKCDFSDGASAGQTGRSPGNW